tara:strand:- start:164 stop:889 length:726 start_codon:yes stop_codon:yes gene_type:complete
MEKRKSHYKNFLIITILSLFLIAFSMQFIVAAETVGGEILETISVGSLEFGNFGKMLESFSEGTGFARFLFFMLVTLIVFGIVSFLPFMGERKPVLSFGISVIIGILSTFYLKDTEVYSILMSYGALGITLTVLIPFIIILLMSSKLYEQGYSFFSKVVWIIFGVVLIFRWLSAPTSEIGVFGTWVYPISAIAVLIMFIWDRQIYKLFLSQKMVDKIDSLERQLKAQSAKRKAEAEDVENA